jgi:hypothetical protein
MIINAENAKKIIYNYDKKGKSEKVIGYAIEVHRKPGPGLLESVNEYAGIITRTAIHITYIARRRIRLPADLFRGRSPMDRFSVTKFP